MEKYIEILVIDDDEGFTTECVEFLQNKCNIGADKALTAEEAENKLENFPIKIILLDYDMPVNGLALFPRLKKIDPYVEIILLVLWPQMTCYISQKNSILQPELLKPIAQKNCHG